MKYNLVRGSEVQSFLRCRKQWQLRWVRGLKPKRPDGKIFFGNLMHKFLEEYHMSGDFPSGIRAARSMFEETDTSRMEQVEIDGMWDLLKSIASNYAEKWFRQDRQFHTIATEFTFAIPLTNGIAYTGTIDILMVDDFGQLWFMDHKCGISMSLYVERIEMDRQISRYFWALQQLAEGNGYVLVKHEQGDYWVPVKHWMEVELTRLPSPHGFIYNLIKRDVPSVPEILKKGGISVAKNQNTTVAVYKQALLDNGLAVITDGTFVTEDKYQEMLDHLASQEDEHGDKFFKRVRVFREQVELDAAIQEFYASAVEAENLREIITDEAEYYAMPYDPVYRNIDDHCKLCQMKELCKATFDGSNGDMIANLFYEKDEETLSPRSFEVEV